VAIEAQKQKECRPLNLGLMR